ncbi:MAG: acylneuraminate cytidylyltransferase family protein [Lentisphaerae bacterium]|nr:acylneuraminate cytidylyltransferase family protein [Lentisphaerota bacterium]
MKKSVKLAIIPARSGSKGLIDKNILPLAGKPLIAYSIEAARKSGMFDLVFVSTDSEKYAQIAREYGADVPILRPAAIAGDTASSWSAVDHALDYYMNQLGYDVETFMLLQPTSPLRTAEDIIGAFKYKAEKSANAVVSVCKPEHAPAGTLALPDDLNMTVFHEHFKNMIARQQLPQQYYRLNGAMYMADTAYYLRANDIYQEKCYAYEMPTERSFDIDGMVDFIICETLIKHFSLQ